MTARDPSLVDATVAFARALRARGIPVTPSESLDAVRALGAIDVGDRREVYWALRAVLTTRPEDAAPFDELFDQYWRRPGDELAAPRLPSALLAKSPSTPQARPRPRERRQVPSLEQWLRGDPPQGEGVAIRTASDRAARTPGDVAGVGTDDAPEVARAAARIARKLAARRSRRWKAARQGARIDLRRSVRWSLRTGGDVLALARRERALRKTKLVALCDVSGSMDLYSRFLLQFLYALQQSFARVDSYLFGTRLTRATPHLREREYASAVRALAEGAVDWSGGTRIGASLRTFVEEFAASVDRRTIVIVLSDGWDTGEPEQLSEAMAALRRRAGRIIWLNPLLANPAYRPESAGMQAALPYVDVFAPAHNLASLQALARHLEL